MSLPSSTDNLKQTAELYRWALEHSLIDSQEVWRWCEQVAQQSNAPQSVVRAVQSPRRWHDSLLNALTGVQGECDPASLAREGFAVLHRYLEGAPHELLTVLRLLRREPFCDAALDERARTELAALQKQWSAVLNKAYAPEVHEQARQELTANVLSFLQHAARGELNGYERRETAWPRAKKTRLFYLTCVLAVLCVVFVVLLCLAMPLGLVAILVVPWCIRQYYMAKWAESG